ncbi:MAG: hypothetical protein ACYC27_13075 [Armatimonadota bacterium]
MDLHAISTVAPGKAMDWLAQNWAMIFFVVLAIGSAVYGIMLAIQDKIRTGSNVGFKEIIKGFALMLAIFIGTGIIIFAIDYIVEQISLGNPYAKAVRIISAVILPGLFFGYLFASASNMLVRITNTNRSLKYLHHLGISIAYFLVLIGIYNMFVRPVIDGLHPLFPWLGILTGWILAPVFISRGYADFNIRIRVEEEQVQE